MADDILIGTISGYDFETIACWCNSLERSGYQGRRVMLVANGDAELLKKLRERGFEVVTYKEDPVTGAASHPSATFTDEDISSDRFYLIWQFLSSQRLDDTRYVIAADVRDVVFQSDPTLWLSRHLGDKLLNVSSEALAIEHQEWNRSSVMENFGVAVYERLRSRPIWNAGVIAGTAYCFRDLCLNIHLLCRASVSTYSDQAALNVILSLEPYHRITRFSLSEDGWACHAGVIADPELEKHGTLILEPLPVFDGRRVYTAGGLEYVMVHQYDRISAWLDATRAEFGSRPAEAEAVARTSEPNAPRE